MIIKYKTILYGDKAGKFGHPMLVHSIDILLKSHCCAEMGKKAYTLRLDFNRDRRASQGKASPYLDIYGCEDCSGTRLNINYCPNCGEKIEVEEVEIMRWVKKEEEVTRVVKVKEAVYIQKKAKLIHEP